MCKSHGSFPDSSGTASAKADNFETATAMDQPVSNPWSHKYLRVQGARLLSGNRSGGFPRRRDQRTDGPALHASSVRIIQLQHVLKDHHCLCADDQGERFAQILQGRGLELIPGGFERGLNQGCAAVLTRGEVFVVLAR